MKLSVTTGTRRRYVLPAGKTTESGSGKFLSDGEKIIPDHQFMGNPPAVDIPDHLFGAYLACISLLFNYPPFVTITAKIQGV